MAGPESKVVDTPPKEGDVPSKKDLLAIIENDEDAALDAELDAAIDAAIRKGE